MNTKMRPLSKLEQALFTLGACLVLAGAVLYMLRISNVEYAFAVGAVLFSWMQIKARYDGMSFVVRRLRRQQLIGAACFVLTAVLMYFNRHPSYGYFCHNEWIVTLTVGAILQLYTSFRIPSELEKEK